MKTLEEQIAVMKHFANGGEVEIYYHNEDIWEDIGSPMWDWSRYDYRIKENKQTITIEKWVIKVNNDYKVYEASSGWFDFGEKIKLLDSYEIDISSTEE